VDAMIPLCLCCADLAVLVSNIRKPAISMSRTMREVRAVTVDPGEGRSVNSGGSEVVVSCRQAPSLLLVSGLPF
jgi:hypothetical protein